MAQLLLAALYSTAGMAMILHGEDARLRGRSLATYQVAGLLGAALGPALGGLVAQEFGPQAPFLLYAALAALAALLIARHLADPGSLIRTAEAEAQVSGRKLPAWRAFLAPSLMGLWLAAFALAFTRVGTQLAALPLLGSWQLGLSPQQVGLALSLSGFASLLIFYPAGWLADKYGRVRMVVLGGIAMIGALAAFSSSGNYSTFVVAALLLGAGSGLAGPSPAAYLADTVPGEDRATSIGMYGTVGDAGAAVAPPILGWLADWGGFDAALMAPALLLLGAVGIFAWLASRE